RLAPMTRIPDDLPVPASPSASNQRTSSRFGWLGLEVTLALTFAAVAGWRPTAAPMVTLAALATTPWALLQGFRALRGTELKGALHWACVTIALGIATQGLALCEPLASGRPIAGHLCYLTTLAALAALISVLNARTPGGGAWAILMALLVLVFLIPWLEGAGLREGISVLGRLRLENPWSLFYGFLVLAGVTNFLPTRFGPSALWLLLGFALEFLGLSGWIESKPTRALIWAAVPCTFASACLAAARREGQRAGDAGSGTLESLWLWFRDHWGVVWGLRVLERFNRTAEAQGWTLRLTWQGVQNGRPEDRSEEAALTLLKGLLRRFAQPSRLDEASSTGR
ncbi:MAG: hypothetical protein AB7I30_18085, partial [Isosphaeraceae bacterium]